MRYTTGNWNERKPDHNRKSYGQKESGRGENSSEGGESSKRSYRKFNENGDTNERYKTGGYGAKRQARNSTDSKFNGERRSGGQWRDENKEHKSFRGNKFEDGHNPRFSKSRNSHNRYDSEQQHFSRYTEDDGVRLNRYIANAGVCSRRDAEQYILAGVITINGKVVTELATKVHYGDVVKFNNAPLTPEKKTYILLNKPKDYVTTTEDPHAEKTVMDLIGDSIRNRVYPVGRLDRATTGLLLLTNDGDLAEHLCHPKYNKQKIYHVTLDRKVEEEDIEKLINGVELEDGPASADEIEYCNPENLAEVGVVIHNGRNRIVRRMFEALEYKVKKLDRVYYAGLTKKNLPRGKWRFLTDREIAMLKRGTYK